MALSNDDKAQETHEVTVRDAENVLRHEYWDDVRGIAEEARANIKSGELADAESLDRWLHESIDGCQRVIYTAQAMDGLRWSHNDEAMFEKGCSDPSLFKDGIPWSQIMYFALLADVRDALGDIDELFKQDDETNS